MTHLRNASRSIRATFEQKELPACLANPSPMMMSGFLMRVCQTFRTVAARNFAESGQCFQQSVDALQHFEQHGEVCPMDWEKGDDAMVPDHAGVSGYLSK